MDERPTHLDLFSGIGGFTIAAQRAGFRTIGFSEVDPYASAVLRKHWPSVTNYGDVRTIPAVRCDLITGGFPCQPHSLAGKRRGSADDRHLWPAMRDVIRRCKPAWVLGENVYGIVGMELHQVLSDMGSLGYRVQSLVIPACAVDAPHRRDRVWIVANASGGRCGGTCGEAEQPRGTEAISTGEAMANPSDNRPGRREQQQDQEGKRHVADGWPVEPDVGRVAHGIPARVDRLRALGNAIVPQVAYQILKAIREQI